MRPPASRMRNPVRRAFQDHDLLRGQGLLLAGRWFARSEGAAAGASAAGGVAGVAGGVAGVCAAVGRGILAGGGGPGDARRRRSRRCVGGQGQARARRGRAVVASRWSDRAEARPVFGGHVQPQATTTSARRTATRVLLMRWSSRRRQRVIGSAAKQNRLSRTAAGWRLWRGHSGQGAKEPPIRPVA